MTGTVVVLPAATSTTLPGTPSTATTTTMTATSTTRTSTTTTTLPPALQCEDTVARHLATLGHAVVECHIRMADRTARHRRVRDGVCERRGRTRYGRAVRRLSPGRCPGCLLRNLADLRDRMTALLDGLAPEVYCAPVAGDARASRWVLRCEDGAARSSARLLRGLTRCRIHGANAPFTGQPFDEAACRATVKDRFDGAVGKLRLGLCPSCLDPDRLRDQLESGLDGLGATVYCAP